MVEFIAMIGMKNSFKVWAVKFASSSDMFAWVDAHPEIVLNSWSPIVDAESALVYASLEAERKAAQ
ncbi:hypothetical protein ACIPY3_02705 [Paenarthrobacter sp. NPDC089714]|uniref:hypothetical protein n=1 Tax=Paenarthrobacter sp. NPDC089714 TaxID=3364377 RepID=UPI0037F39494